jgi:hypothetical protein
LVLAILTVKFTYAQATNTGTIVGQVEDQSGAVVPGASVTLIDVSTKGTRTTTTNHTGQYVFVNVSPSVYDITVSKTGFEIEKLSNQTVQVGTQTTANFKLHLGSEQQTVEVQATGADLQTLNATVGTTVDQEAIAQLPSLLHDAGTFTTLQAGISPDGSVAGSVVDQSTFSLDGGNNTNDMDGSMSVYTGSFAGDPTGGNASGSQGLSTSPTGVLPTPADSVEEFKVNATGQTADFNNSAGAQVEVVTKRGTNQWHGTGYEYYLDNNFSANTWQNNTPGPAYAAPPDYHYSKFGFGGGGPIIPKGILGGKTYLFALYQGYRFPESEIYERTVPSASMQAGLVTFNGTTYDLKALDPRGLGVNPIVAQLWSKYEPTGNDTSCGANSGTECDGTNEIGYKANLSIPQKDNFFVARMDHDFGDKWHWMTSYRYYKLTKTVDNQVDIGGFFTGDKLGTPASTASRPQQPWFFVTGLTTNISQGITNDFHYSFLRNYWSWSDNNAPPQFSGLGGALEPFGESAGNVLAPFNVNTQSIRTRFWDGKDHFLRDDVTFLKGHHLLNFGGQYQHNFDYHERSDNGGGINFTPTYQLGDSSGSGQIDLSALQAQGYPTGPKASRVAAAVYGMVTDAQVAYTRSGTSLALNAPLTHAFDKSTIPYYNVYFSDTWHMKPSFTLTYGLGWTLEMPPTEASGKQDVLVDDSDTPVKTLDYLAQRKAAALQGQVYNPELGFALVGNVGAGDKYPYNPFYGSFSPRVAAAWNPHFGEGFLGHVFGHDDTVIRGGYGRVYGRLNGVDLVLVPLLGIGLIQPVQCKQALSTGACGPVNPDATTAFRIGTDGQTAPLPAASATLPQPVYPGFNNAEGATAEGLDPNFRPNVSDTFNLTIQRRISRSQTLEVGYIGRLIHHEYQPVNLNAVPYMMVQGGQSFQNAYAALETAIGCTKSMGACMASVAPNTITPQPFFEAALAGTGYCTGFASCTAAVLSNEFSNLQGQYVWSIWSDLDNGGFNFPRSMQNTPIPGSTYGGQASSGLALNASIGYGNYNGGFITLVTQSWHGLLMHNNFTYSKALGTGAEVQATSEYTPNDPFDLRKMYGVQPFNRKFVFNSYLVYDEPFFKGQQGLLGRVAGGWSLAPIFTSGSGEPLWCNSVTDGQSFGGADAANYFDNEQCVFTSKYTGGVHSHYGVSGGNDPYGNAVGTSGFGGQPVNMFKDPVAVWNMVRAPILGIDTKDSGLGPLNGTPYWNVDLSLQKNVKVYERATLTFSMIFTNVFNHNVLEDQQLQLSNPSTFGVQNTQLNNPRNMEFGARVSF